MPVVVTLPLNLVVPSIFTVPAVTESRRMAFPVICRFVTLEMAPVTFALPVILRFVFEPETVLLAVTVVPVRLRSEVLVNPPVYTCVPVVVTLPLNLVVPSIFTVPAVTESRRMAFPVMRKFVTLEIIPVTFALPVIVRFESDPDTMLLEVTVVPVRFRSEVMVKAPV